MAAPQVMSGTRYHMQRCTGQQAGKVLAHGHRADRITVTPQQQHRHAQFRQARTEIAVLIEKPTRRLRIFGGEIRLPVLGTERWHVHPARSDAEYQVGNPFGPFERCAHRNDTAHGLRHQCGGLVDGWQQASDQVIQALHLRIRRGRSESGPADMQLVRGMGELPGGRAPEVGVARGPGKKDKRGGLGRRHRGARSDCSQNASL